MKDDQRVKKKRDRERKVRCDKIGTNLNLTKAIREIDIFLPHKYCLAQFVL